MVNTFSDNVRKIRLQKGLSQDHLSKNSNITLNTIVHIEINPKANPTLNTIKKIANGLGVSIIELLK